MTQLQHWTVHDEAGAWLATFGHPALADIFASTLTDITHKSYSIRDSESPAQKIINFLKENQLNNGGQSNG